MAKADLTAQRLREILNYNPDTGVFTWAAKTCRKVVVGKLAGTSRPDGYVMIRIDERRYLAHRLAWLWVTGEWPACFIDHRDGIPANNSWNNLREATPRLNSENRHKVVSASGRLGVTAQHGKFVAKIQVHGQKRHLGVFDSADEAYAVYLAAKRTLHEGCTL